jgi:cation transport ATPase
LEAISKEKTKKSLKGLLSLVPAEATVLRDGIPVLLPAEEIRKGDVLVVKNGASMDEYRL